MSYNELRQTVKNAWKAISEDYLKRLITQMKERCQTVIDAKGKYIVY